MIQEINGFLVKVLEIDTDIFYGIYLPENPHVALWNSSKNYRTVKAAMQAGKKQVEALNADDYRG